MPNSIAFAQNYTSVIDEVYQRASVSGVLNSGRRMVRAGDYYAVDDPPFHNALVRTNETPRKGRFFWRH